MKEVQSLLTVKDLIQDKLTLIEQGHTVYEAAKEMKKNQVTSVLVKDTLGKIVGIVTDMDIVYQVVATDANPKETKVEKIMTKDLLTIAGNESMFKARKIMMDKKVMHLVVTNSEKQIGVVTAKEILGHK